jgi:hypothetical protein
MNSGLILLTKNKTKPSEYQLEIRNNFKIIIEHKRKYILAYFNDDKRRISEQVFYVATRKIAGGHQFIIDSDVFTNNMKQIIKLRETKKIEPHIKFIRDVYNQL